MPKRLSRKLRSFVRRPLIEQLWFPPVWLLLGASRLLILMMPFRRLAPHLGRHHGTAAWVPLIAPRQQATANHIRRIVQMTAKYTPWESNCFPQAVVARLLLGLYGIPCSVFFGVSRTPDNKSMQAHAWVASGRVRVSGGESFEHFSVVGCFSAPSARNSCDLILETRYERK